MNLETIKTKMLDSIDLYSSANEDQWQRVHLGASYIGGKCLREIWYKFRHALNLNKGARMNRLLQRGKDEEIKVINMFRAMGYKVFDFDEQGKQFSFKMGHFAGSIDAILMIPTEMGNYDAMLLEVKTSNKKRFEELKKYGLLKSNPQYFAQAQVYAYAFNLSTIVHYTVCKDNDEIYIELIETDRSFVENEILARAEYIVKSQVPPEKMSEDPSYWECNFCDYKQVCHFLAPADEHCGTCRFMHTRLDGEWFCTKYEQPVPKEYLKNGCTEFRRAIND